MKQTTHEFLRFFINAYHSNKYSLVVASTKGANQCLAIFKAYGLIKDFEQLKAIKETNINKIINVSEQKKHKFILVKLKQWPQDFSKENVFTNQVTGREYVNRGHGIHKLELLRKPSRPHYKIKVSFKELVGLVPHKNVIYLMQTSKGIITSEEALRFRVGGTLILAIRL